MKSGPWCWGTFVTFAVLDSGVSKLDHATLAMRPAAGVARVAAATAVQADPSLSGASLYQLDSEWTTDQGARVRLKSLAGSSEVLAMVFTRCPSVCPTLVHDLKMLDASLPKRDRAATKYVLVTIDPAHDTPQELHAYRSRMGLDPERWTLLRGDDADTQELAAVLGFAYGKSASGSIAHSSLVTVLDKGGVIVHQQTGIGADPARTIAAIQGSLASR